MADNTKYLDIADKIKKKILLNYYAPNQLIPSEKDLLTEYNVSRRTIRRAVSSLIENGFLYTVQGKGTYVCENSRNNYKVDMDIDKLLYRGFDNARFINAQIISPDIYDVYNLHIAPKDKLIVIKWVLERRKKPIAFDVKRIPYISGIPIEEADLGFSSLYVTLKKKFPSLNINQETGIRSGIPDDEVYNSLKIEKQHPLLVFEMKLEADEDRILATDTLYALNDEFKLNGESL